MKITKGKVGYFFCLLLISVFIFSSCYTTRETVYTPGGNIKHKTLTSGSGSVINELRQEFRGTVLEGNGMFDNDNEGLARRTAINLAVAELAAKVQTRVRAESTIYNNKDVRDVVENRVAALVNNYEIETAGYDPGTTKYRARISITGEEIVRRFEKELN